MTSKELLYVEDALAHAQLLKTQFQTAAAQLQDPMLRAQVQKLADSEEQICRQIYHLV